MSRPSLSRKECRQSKAKAYQAIRDAHAQGIKAKYLITTSPDGEILSGKLKWCAAVRTSAFRTLDFKIREYKKHSHHWNWAIERIEKEVDDHFAYTHPLRKGSIQEYVRDHVIKDRHKFKKHWVATNGEQHPDCPDEAFAVLDKYWRTDAAKDESEKMKGVRSAGKKRSRSSSAPASDRHSDVPIRTFPCLELMPHCGLLVVCSTSRQHGLACKFECVIVLCAGTNKY